MKASQPAETSSGTGRTFKNNCPEREMLLGRPRDSIFVFSPKLSSGITLLVSKGNIKVFPAPRHHQARYGGGNHISVPYKQVGLRP
jgi:hypothetical protein